MSALTVGTYATEPNARVVMVSIDQDGTHTKCFGYEEKLTRLETDREKQGKELRHAIQHNIVRREAP